jgi:organic radical activating enzyme
VGYCRQGRCLAQNRPFSGCEALSGLRQPIRPRGRAAADRASDAPHRRPAVRETAAQVCAQPTGSALEGLAADGARIRAIWCHQSRQNSILFTERCNHYCLMCSQPPKTANDDPLLDDAFELVRLLSPDTAELGFTGGEPTLYGERLIDLLRLCRNLLPHTAIHVLSNGRRFVDPDFAASWAAIDNANMMVGIPLYGAEPALHDYVVQANGAFDETVQGILNLGSSASRLRSESSSTNRPHRFSPKLPNSSGAISPCRPGRSDGPRDDWPGRQHPETLDRPD